MLEASRFENPNNPYNAQQVLAPWNFIGRINRFAIPQNAGPAMVSIDWFPSLLVYQIECSKVAFTMTWSPNSSIVPEPTGFERLYINVWLNFGYPPSDGNDATFTITSFEFSSAAGSPAPKSSTDTPTPTPTPIATTQTPMPAQTTTSTPTPDATASLPAPFPTSQPTPDTPFPTCNV
jgi:hypothetical protein